MLRSLLSTILFVFSSSILLAQTILVRDFKQEGQQVMLNVVIDAHHSPREKYDLTLSSSFDGSPFQKLEKVWREVEPGNPLNIRLDPSELKGTGSQLALKVDIKASIFPLEIYGDKKTKKGKSFSARWTGYNDRGPYKVELIGGDVGRITLATAQDATLTNQALSKDIDKGAYKLRITPQNADAYGEMDFKVVGSKAALLIVPLVAGGGAAAYFLTGGEPEGATGLPDPPINPDLN